MAVPSVATVSPNKGHTGGRLLVEVTGSGFRLPTGGEESVAVYFGSDRSLRVDVASETRLFAVAPKHDVGDVAIRVVNIDANGDPIAGEEVTEASAFSFLRPLITSEHDSELTQLVRALIRDLKLQLIDNVTISTNSDYQSAGGVEVFVTQLAELPGIVLIGPDTEENRFYSKNEDEEVDVAFDDQEDPVEFIAVDPPRTVDVLFSIFGFSNLKTEATNLMQLVAWYFKENKFFSLTKGALHDDDGESYEMDLTQDPRTVGGIGNDNLHGFAARMTIRGFDLDVVEGLGLDPIVNATKVHGSYTDDQGAELLIEQASSDPSLVVRSVLSGPGLTLNFEQARNPVVRSQRSGR